MRTLVGKIQGREDVEPGFRIHAPRKVEPGSPLEHVSDLLMALILAGLNACGVFPVNESIKF